MSETPAERPAESGPLQEPVRPPPELPPVVRRPDGSLEHPEVRYEKRDVRVKWVVGVLLVACCIAALHYFLALEFFWSQMRGQAALKKSPFPLSPHPSEQLPAEPRLEAIDREAGIESGNVFEREVRKEQILHSYGPTDEKGYVHIPVGKAMELLAGKLPVRERPSGQPVKDNGLVDSGEPNSGRMLRGAPRW
jgi:hypothetical protein